MRTPEGRVVGQHQGLMYYTLGQRQGLGIGGVKGAEEGVPWFVAGKDMAANELIVVQGHEHPLLLSDRLSAGDLTWVGPAPEAGRRYTAKTRYRQQDAGCLVESLADGRLELVFDEPQWAVTPGQSVVMYDGDVCLGGGTTDSKVASGSSLLQVPQPFPSHPVQFFCFIGLVRRCALSGTHGHTM